jgi:hypothetical protein
MHPVITEIAPAKTHRMLAPDGDAELVGGALRDR